LNRILALDFASSLRSLRGFTRNKKSNGITTFKDVRSLNSHFVVGLETSLISSTRSHPSIRSASPTYEYEKLKNYEKLKSLQHRCSVCDKLRSPDYHEKHPLAPGEIPLPGICRRCVKKSSSTQANPGVIENIIEIHHYHHSCSCHSHTKEEKRELGFEIPDDIALPPIAELPGYDNAKDVLHSTRQSDPPPPPVRTWRKPKLTNNHVIQEMFDNFEIGGWGGWVGPVAG
jgi:hypothetical protein